MLFLNPKIRSYVDFLTLRQIFQGNDYGLEKVGRRRELISHYQKIVQSGKLPLIIDCGGNIGLASKYFNNEYPEAIVVCIEPDHLNIEQGKLIINQVKYIFWRKRLVVVSREVQLLTLALGNGAIAWRSLTMAGQKLFPLTLF